MPANAGNSFSTAGDLNLSPTIQTFTDSVNPFNLNDYYRFNLGSAGYINLSLKGASANVDLQLIQDLNKKWTMPIQDWKAALNRFAIEFEGRFPL